MKRLKLKIFFIALLMVSFTYAGLKVSSRIPIDKGGVARATERCRNDLDKQCRDSGKQGVNPGSISTVESSGQIRCAGECL